jgi:hypothetical protein
MRWLFRSSLILAFLGLASLAVLPHAEALRREWQYLRQVWQLVRSDVPMPATEPEQAAAPEPDRNRSVLKPNATAPQAASATASIDNADSADSDPFLAEARRRAQDDPAEAMQWLQTEFSGPERLRGMLEVVALWAAKDSENALLWLESNAQGLARLETLHSGIEHWSQQDPSATATWVEGMANDGSKVSAAKALATSWAQQAPEQAAAWVNQLPAGSIREQAAAALIESWGRSAPEQAATWALSQAAFSDDTELLNLGIRQYTQSAPAEAAQFLRSVNEAYQAPAAIEAYVRTRAQSNPVEAMTWQASLGADDPINQPDNAEIIMQEWSRTDSVAASTWLNDTPAGPQRDAAIVGFTHTMLDFEPEAAVAWSNSMTDPEARVQQLNRAIQHWARSQPAEALEWVNSAGLEPGLRTDLASEIGAD